MGALWDFQVAMVTALKADSTLLGLIGGASHIADWPDPNTAYPLVTLGEDKNKQWNMKDEAGNKIITARLHVWSNKKGWKESKLIADQLDVILLEGQLQLDGSSAFTIIGKGQRPNDMVFLPGDDEGKIRHTVADYIFWLSC
jgi:hypothetical protein